MPILEVTGLSKRFGGFVALEGSDLSVAEGERAGLTGPNGSGKSPLVNCICGTLTTETGSVRFNGAPVDGLVTHERTRRGMARSFQLPRPFVTLTVADNLRVPLLYTVNARPGHSLTPAELDARCLELLQVVGLADKAGKLPRDLTQVEMRKLELARAMAADPKLLIADESMAGLSQSEVDDIVALLIRLNERGITIILIEHIMRAVMKFSQRLIVLVSGKKIADGAPDLVIRAPEVEEAYLGQYAHHREGRRRLRRGARVGGRLAQRQQRRDRGAARDQRQRQVDADEVRDGHLAPARRPHHRRDRRRAARSGRPQHRGDRRSRHRAGARGPAIVPAPHRRGEPVAGRFPQEGAPGAEEQPRLLLRVLPAPGRAPRPARRLDERRRAADAGAGARADAGAAHSADRRALGRLGAGAGQPHHRQDQGAQGPIQAHGADG